MSCDKLILHTKFMLLAGILASSILVSRAKSQTPAPAATPAPSGSGSAVHSPYSAQNHLPKRAVAYYETVWGIESPKVKYAESGEIIRFSWRVVDAERAKPLSDKKVNPMLVDPRAGVKLVVPSLEKIGQLRQSSPPEAGKSYWMAFSNKGRLVKRGDRVNVVIGQFHAEGLVVD